MPASGAAWRDEKVEDWADWESRFGGPISTEARTEIEHILFGGRIGRARYPGIPLTEFLRMVKRYLRDGKPATVTPQYVTDITLANLHAEFEDHETLAVARFAFTETGGDVNRLQRKLLNPKTRDEITVQIETEERATIPQLAEVFRRVGLPVNCSTRWIDQDDEIFPDANAFEAFAIEYVIQGDPAKPSHRLRVERALNWRQATEN